MDRRPEKSGTIRNRKGQFNPGVSGNPAGKPPGTISIIAKVKKKFEEDPVYFSEWVDKLLADPNNRRAIMEQIDGKPKQAMELSGKDGKPFVVEISEAVAKKNGLTP